MVALSACTGDSTGPATTSEFYFPEESVASTLLPVIPETLPPPDSVSVPADTMFGGDPCDALDSGTLAVERTEYLSPDACRFTLAGAAGAVETVLVRVVSALVFADEPSGAVVESLVGWPSGVEAAWRVERVAGWVVMVQVDNGWFAVEARTERLARSTARAAVPWTIGGAPTEVVVDPVDETPPTDPVQVPATDGSTTVLESTTTVDSSSTTTVAAPTSSVTTP